VFPSFFRLYRAAARRVNPIAEGHPAALPTDLSAEEVSRGTAARGAAAEKCPGAVVGFRQALIAGSQPCHLEGSRVLAPGPEEEKP
jgi:hypothetical protein